jgi:hypothetical protein
LLLDLRHRDIECLVAVECCGHLLIPLSGLGLFLSWLRR